MNSPSKRYIRANRSINAGVFAALFIFGQVFASPATASTQELCQKLLSDPDIDLDSLVDAGCQLTAEQISRAMDNPVGEMVSLPIQYDRLNVKEPVFNTTQTIETLKVIPTFPVRLGEWNLVNRIVLSFPKVPVDADAFGDFTTSAGNLDTTISGPPLVADPFAGSTTGFGDMAYVGLFTPEKSTKLGEGKFIWAVGPSVILPTASKKILGQGKYQLGPALALAYLGPDWTLGVFPQHWWSIAGDSSRSSVNQSNIQYFVYRKLPNQWAIGASPNISIDWSAKDAPEVNLPIGIGVSKTTFIGKIPTRIGVELNYYALRADDGLEPKWGLRFSLTPAVPAAFLR